MKVDEQFEFNPKVDAAIIGGGVIGLTIARVLKRRGMSDVIVIEKGEFGREASWAAGGILAPQVEADAADDFFRLACKSRDLYPQFKKLGATIVGCSRDSLKSHEGFKEKMAFPFELLSDAEEKLCSQFDVIKMKNMYGKKVRGIERSTFVIDGDGKLAKEWRGVKVPGHAQAVLDFVKTL